MHKLQELVRLHRTGRGKRDVARELCMGPNTERRYRAAIENAGLLRGDPLEIPELEVLRAAVLKSAPPKLPPQQQSTIAKWREVIRKLHATGLKPRAIRDRLRLEDPRFDGSRSAVQRIVATIEREHGMSQTTRG